MKKIKILILTVLGVIALVCACLAAGCKFSYSLDEIKEKYGLSAQVTYFLNLHQGKDGNYNGGKFNDGLLIKDIYYKEGEIPLNLGEVLVSSGSTKLLVDDGYNFSGWHSVKTDAEGKLLYEDGTVYSEENKFDGTKPMKKGEAYDFTKPLAKNEHIYLCGDFFEDVKLRFKFFCAEDDFNVEINGTDAEGNEVLHTYEAGKDVIDEVSYIIPKSASGLSDVTSIVNIPGYTVIDLYASESDAKPFSGWPITYPEPDETTGELNDVILYAKLLKGTWRIVRTPSDVETMFSRAMKTNYYILQDIDCGGLQVSTRNSFTGQIYGGKSGHTISNFVAKNSVALRNGVQASLFGKIAGDAEIKNVAFKEFSVELEVMKNHDPNINFITNTITEGAKFENFVISGELKITDEANSLMIDESDWIFGSNEVYAGITVEKAICSINGEERFKVEKTINSDTKNTEDQL